MKYLQVLGMFASSYMIVAMTMDRHYAICCPLQAHRSGATQRCTGYIVLAWGLSLVLSLPQVGVIALLCFPWMKSLGGFWLHLIRPGCFTTK